MDETFTCPHCHTAITPADAWWDELRESGPCPACAHARRLQRRVRIFVIAAVALVIVPIASCYVGQWRPWDENLRLIRQPRTVIQSALLKDAPLGSSMAEVRALIERKHWRRLDRYTERDDAIEAELGQYSRSVLMVTGVFATWAFNADGKLIELKIVKAVDGP